MKAKDGRAEQDGENPSQIVCPLSQDLEDEQQLAWAERDRRRSLTEGTQKVLNTRARSLRHGGADGGVHRVEGSQGAWAALSKGDSRGDGVREQVGSVGAGLHGQGRGGDVISRPAGTSRRLPSIGVMGSELHFKKDLSSFWVENKPEWKWGMMADSIGVHTWMRMARWQTMMMEAEEVDRFDVSFGGRTGSC